MGREVAKFADKEIHELLLTPPSNAYKRVRKSIEASVEAGRQQISKDASKSEPYSFETKDILENLVTRLVDLTVSRVVNEVQGQASTIIATLGILGLDRDEIEDLLLEELGDRSVKTFERIAAQAVNKAVNEGRRVEMEERAEDIATYEYSAVLDNATCENCDEWDGVQASSLDDLPETPNPICLGGANCRCFTIAIFSNEGKEV